MKLLALMPDSYAGFGGIAQYNRDLLDALCADERVERVTAVVRHAGAVTAEYPVRYSEYVAEGSPLRFITQALRLHASVRPDAVLCGHLNLLPVAARVARLRSLPLYLELYGIEAWEPHPRISLRQCGAVTRSIAISRYTRERFLAWAPVDPLRVSVLPNTIDLSRYTPGEAPAALRVRYTLGPGPILLTVGRLSSSERYKGHDRVLAALPALLAVYPTLQYLIGGDGDDRPRLEACAAAAGITDHVTFIGRINERELADHYRLADVFVMPSTGEGFGFVFLEAAACGTPVVGGGNDGSRDALRDGRLGSMVDPDDNDALVRALCAALDGRAVADPRTVSVFQQKNFELHLRTLLLGTPAAASLS